MSKFKFGKGEGFKMPGLGSKEINTPGSFRQEQGVEDVGYCLNTEESMLPKGSSPLLAKDASFLIPDYYSTTYTGSSGGGDQKKTIVEEGERGSEDDTKVVPEINTEVPETKTDIEDDPSDTKEYAKRKRQETTYTGESAQSKLGRDLTQDEMDWMNKEIKRLGGVEAYRKEYKLGPTTIDVYEISFDGGKTYRPASKKEYDAHGGAKKKS